MFENIWKRRWRGYIKEIGMAEFVGHRPASPRSWVFPSDRNVEPSLDRHERPGMFPYVRILINGKNLSVDRNRLAIHGKSHASCARSMQVNQAGGYGSHKRIEVLVC